MNSVFAVNGTGKSSIYDALHYAITGSLPKLDKLHPIERAEDYYINRFHGQAEATIELEFETDESVPTTITIKVVRKSNGSRQVSSPSNASDPEAILKSLDDSFTLLDYHTFNTFIDHSPLDRGRSFSTLLGLDVYSDFRQTLKTAIDTRSLKADLGLQALETEVNTYTNTASTAFGRLDTTYAALTGDSIQDVTKLDDYAATAFTALGGIELLKSTTEGKNLDSLDFQEVSQIIKAAEGGKDRDKLASVSGTITKLRAVGNPDTSALVAEQTGMATMMEEAAQLLAATAGDIRKSLYAAAGHLISEGGWHDETTCPLCSSQLARPIAELIAEQQQYAQFDAKVAELKTAWQDSQWRARISSLEQTVGTDLPDEEKLFRTSTERYVKEFP